ncbi:MAG: hypothetical protein WD907_00500, partial [Bacilli bacterium]
MNISTQHMKEEDVRRKNQFVMIALLISIILAVLTEIAIKQPFQNILIISIGGSVLVGLTAFLHKKRKFTTGIPFINIIVLVSLTVVLMESSVSITNLFMLYYILIISAIYMLLPVLLLSSVSGLGLMVYYLLTNGEQLNLT